MSAKLFFRPSGSARSTSGKVSFPVIPILGVVALVGLCILYNYSGRAVMLGSDYVFTNSDIDRTAIREMGSNQPVDFIVVLNPAGTKRLADWAAGHDAHDIAVAYDDHPMGRLALQKDVNPRVLHLRIPAQQAIGVKYSIGR